MNSNFCVERGLQEWGRNLVRVSCAYRFQIPLVTKRAWEVSRVPGILMVNGEDALVLDHLS